MARFCNPLSLVLVAAALGSASCGKTKFMGGGGGDRNKAPGSADGIPVPPTETPTPPAPPPQSTCSLVINSSPVDSYGVTDGAGPSELELPMEVRDFAWKDDATVGAKEHPDFQKYYRQEPSDRFKATTKIVGEVLGDDDAPVFASTGAEEPMVSSKEMFDTWYHDTPWSKKLVEKVTLTRKAGSNVFSFGDRDKNFFPIDGKGFGNQGNPHNFHFTTALRTSFVYHGGETFTFVGDDDLWVFIDRRLALDLGGTHHKISETISLDDAKLKLEKGKEYSLMVFHAERFSGNSYYYIETTIDLKGASPYTYAVTTSGALDGPPVFSLKEAPRGMSIDRNTGLVSWAPKGEASLVGKQAVVVEASDGRGCSAVQSYQLDVKWATN